MNLYKLKNENVCLKEITKYFSNFHKNRFASEVLRRLGEIRELTKEKFSRKRRDICLNGVS